MGISETLLAKPDGCDAGKAAALACCDCLLNILKSTTGIMAIKIAARKTEIFFMLI
jgi:hypothetical protein